ncbi:VanZ family protein [Alkalicoccus chagannorensis]|uniref:VanZ family protein n=1 Tax=Alkalicoccus chagannorensis TaxID=427072 RepID=UPI000409D5C0|nr:VanZ family protein [Alkalicoccus chagannorensis]
MPAIVRALLFAAAAFFYTAAMWHASPEELLHYQDIIYRFNPDPTWTTFLEPEQIRVYEAMASVNMMSHILGTSVLGFLFFHWLGLRAWTVVTLALFVTSVELLQPFFGRTAWLIDIGFNLLGLTIGAFLYWYWRHRGSVVT